MMRKANCFSTIILLACCLGLSLSPITASATDQLSVGVVSTEDADNIEESVAIEADLPLEPAVKTTEKPTTLSTSPSIASDPDTDGPIDEPPLKIQKYGLVITQVQTRSLDDSRVELIEIRNNSTQRIDITNWRLYYTNANSGTQRDIAEFTVANSQPGWRLTIDPGQYLVFVSTEFVDASPNFVNSGTFSSTLANSSGRLLITDDSGRLQDGIAWGEANPIPERGNPVPVPSTGQVVIERKVGLDGWHQDTGSNLADFEVKDNLKVPYLIGSVSEVFDACLNIDDISDIVPDGWYRDDATGNCSDQAPEPMNMCLGLRITEVGANLEEQFIELYNSSDQNLSLRGCQVATSRDASKSYVLDDETSLKPGDYFVLMISDTNLRINKTTSSTIYLLSQDGGSEVDEVVYSGLKPGTSWSMIDDDWQQTYEATPGRVNQVKLYPDCQAGYIRNIDTGRCNQVVVESEPAPCDKNQFRNPETGRCKLLSAADSALVPCREGQYRNPETNRCKSLTASTSNLVPCGEGEFRNPATNRCKKLASTTSTLKPCQPGYERNPETNRCRKTANLASIAQAGFPVEPVSDSPQSFVGWWALGGAIMLGLGYAGWEWRHEVLGMLRRHKV